jgi:hypothetical protein
MMTAWMVAQQMPVAGLSRKTAMEAREPEQQATMDMADKARRVGSVLISKSNVIPGGKAVTLTMRCNKGLGEGELVAGGR